MKHFTFFYTIFIFFEVILCEQCSAPTNMVGTVLFTTSDVHRECWSPEDIGVLTSRMFLEQLMPDVKFLKIDSNEYVNDLVEYFREVIDSVRTSASGRRKRVLLLAITDLVGGYLHHAVLPIAKKSYYAGLIDFKSMEKLLQLYEEVKWYLRTNGQGWSQPVAFKQELDIPILDITSESKGNKSCCKKLIYYEHEPKQKQSKREVCNAPSNKEVYFPLPFFDAKFHPTAIVVPLRKFALRNIESRSAAYILMKYFVSAEQCLNIMKSSTEVVKKFQDNLYTWINYEVLPKLEDDKFYSAFGGILRVVETLKNAGAKILPRNTTNKCDKVEEGEEQMSPLAAAGGDHKRSKTVLAAMLTIIFLWFIFGTIYICYRMKKNTNKSKMAPSTTMSSSGWSSVWSKTSSKSKTPTTCKCCMSDNNDRTNDYSSTSTEDYRKEKRRNSKDNSPAVIETQHSVKQLPSIAEMSENTSREERNGKSLRRISFVEDSNASSSDNMHSKQKICLPRNAKFIPCPNEKNSSFSSSATKYSNKESGEADLGSEDIDQCLCEFVNQTNENNEESSSISRGELKNDQQKMHSYACHSSLAGNYSSKQQPNEKPYIFGYDFQTTSSSDVSDDDLDDKMSNNFQSMVPEQ